MKKLILLFSFIIIAIFSFAQIEISGKVTYEKEGLPGVNVMIKDYVLGTTTNASPKIP